jgi:nucleoside 2-deoxyribosyltransferase
VNEIYCAGDIWTHAAQRLIELSDVVLIDLREFHAGRHGTATDLGMLARLGALSRTIAIIGKATDLDAVRAATATSLSSAAMGDVLRTLNVEDRIDDEAFFTQVIAAVQPVRS